MRTFFTKKLTVLVLVFLFSFVSTYSSAHVYAAGTPSIFSYQGRLVDSSGNLLGGSGTTYYFKFSIWNVATGGTSGANMLWPAASPTSFSASVAQGVFNVDIGDTDNGYPDVLDFDFKTDDDIYLQIEVSDDDVSFETLSPRHKISSTPFAQVSGSVTGVGQSSFGTTTQANNAVVTVAATTTTSIPALFRGSSGQLADLFQIQNFSGNNLFSINATGGIFGSSTLAIGNSSATSFVVNSSGNVGVGTTAPGRKFNVFETNSSPQLRISQTPSVFGEFYVDSVGDVQLSSTGGNYRLQDENLWVCSGGSCGATEPASKGNVIVETGVIFNNNFTLKQIDASTTVMYDSAGNSILEFDEAEE